MAVPNGVQSFTVAGGTVIVDVENGVLSLVSATPNAGFTIDKSEARSDRVEVEFRGNDTDSRVRVRIDGGRLHVETATTDNEAQAPNARPLPGPPR